VVDELLAEQHYRDECDPHRRQLQHSERRRPRPGRGRSGRR
jgi:hypothetical protein